MILNPSNVGGGFMGGDMGKWWLPLREGKKYFGGTRTMYFNWKFNIFYGQAHTDILYSHCTKIRHFKWKIHFCLTKETSPSRTHLDGRELPLHTLPLAPSLTGSFTALLFVRLCHEWKLQQVCVFYHHRRRRRWCRYHGGLLTHDLILQNMIMPD